MPGTLRADQVDIPREYPLSAAASSTGAGQTATSSLSCCKNLPAGRNVVPAPLPQRNDRNLEPANLTFRAGQQQQSGRRCCAGARFSNSKVHGAAVPATATGPPLRRPTAAGSNSGAGWGSRDSRDESGGRVRESLTPVFRWKGPSQVLPPALPRTIHLSGDDRQDADARQGAAGRPTVYAVGTLKFLELRPSDNT